MAPDVAVLMACHNRCATTKRCLEALRSQVPSDAVVHLYVMDDASTDGTAEMARAVWPDATILRGSGDMYWAAAMAAVERRAIEDGPDFLLWLNDDVTLDQGALGLLLDESRRHPEAIIVGSVRDPQTDVLTYGGLSLRGHHPLRVQPVAPSGVGQHLDTFNGNCVLVPTAVARRVGSIDGGFRHSLADIDFGLRARKAGIRMVLASRSVGTCSRHDRAPARRSLSEALAYQASPHGLPWRSHARFLRRHGGPAWPALLAWGQMRFLVSSLRGQV